MKPILIFKKNEVIPICLQPKFLMNIVKKQQQNYYTSTNQFFTILFEMERCS